MSKDSQKPPRPTPKEHATGWAKYQVLCDQFHGDRVVSVRRIPPNRRSVTGLLPSRKNGKMIAFESKLERDLVTLLEFDNVVKGYEAQPLVLEYIVDGRRRVGYPDFLVEYHEGARTPPLLCDVKYRREIFERWSVLKPRLKAAKAYARDRGYSYRILTEVEIRTPYLNNAAFLLPYQRCVADAKHSEQLFDALRDADAATPQSLLELCSDDRWKQAELIPTLWCLIGQRQILTDLDLPLTMTSQIWLRRVD